MNPQMTLLEARAVAREREHQHTPRRVAAHHRHTARRLSWPSLARHRTAAGRPAGALAARG